MSIFIHGTVTLKAQTLGLDQIKDRMYVCEKVAEIFPNPNGIPKSGFLICGRVAILDRGGEPCLSISRHLFDGFCSSTIHQLDIIDAGKPSESYLIYTKNSTYKLHPLQLEG